MKGNMIVQTGVFENLYQETIQSSVPYNIFKHYSIINKMDFFNISEIKQLLSRHGFQFSKALGQNFLTDSNVVDQIVKMSGIDKNTGVFEVGPGIGTLTASLADKAGKVISVELDRNLLPLLSETLSAYHNVQIIHADILKTNIREVCEKSLSAFSPVACANLPYCITSPALSGLIEAHIFKSITVMVQKEVAMRLCASPGTEDYSAFTVYINFHTVPKLLFYVPADRFIPAPKVDSAVIQLIPRSDPPVSPEEQPLFFRVVRAAFAQRRKTLLNALFSSFGTQLSKEDLSEIIMHCGLDSKVRGETLDIPMFQKIASGISVKTS